MVAGAAHGCAASSWASRANGNQAQHRQGAWSGSSCAYNALQAAAASHTFAVMQEDSCQVMLTMHLPLLCSYCCHASCMYMSCAKSVRPLSTHCMQIRLPKSAGDALMSQDAPKNGAMLFELSTSAGRSLHAGVLDFSAAQGTVGVPEHLIRNLWGLTTGDGQCHGHVIVTYKKLPKGIATAVMQPSIALQCCSQALHCSSASQ